MTGFALAGRRILVVEDEYYLARDLSRSLGEAGATVLGPVSSLADASHLIEAERSLDGAVLDINLGGELVYPAADTLAARHVPFIFLTGYDRASIPERHAGHAHLEKPVEPTAVAAAIGRLMGRRRENAGAL